MNRRDVFVVGSANVDLSISTTRLPTPGETVIGHGALISVGGKGANQAVAAARCGAPTAFAGTIGADAFGGMVLAALDAAGVDRHAVGVLPGIATGLASILVDDAGQNCIAIAPGANAELSPDRVDALAGRIGAAAVLVLQCEVPVESVYRAIDHAATAGTRVILNPAPYRELDLARLAGRIDLLVPNEAEAAQLAGQPLETLEDAQRVARTLVARGIRHVLVTLGARGCLLAGPEGDRLFPPHAVHAIDATGAGDAFVGCLAASLATGLPLDGAIVRANAYAALSTTRRGAQSSYADRAELDAMVRRAASTAG